MVKDVVEKVIEDINLDVSKVGSSLKLKRTVSLVSPDKKVTLSLRYSVPGLKVKTVRLTVSSRTKPVDELMDIAYTDLLKKIIEKFCKM